MLLESLSLHTVALYSTHMIPPRIRAYEFHSFNEIMLIAVHPDLTMLSLVNVRASSQTRHVPASYLQCGMTNILNPYNVVPVRNQTNSHHDSSLTNGYRRYLEGFCCHFDMTTLHRPCSHLGEKHNYRLTQILRHK
jgi:hypothetical protein